MSDEEAMSDKEAMSDEEAMSNQETMSQEMVSPAEIIRDIVGTERLPDLTQRRDGPGLVHGAAHLALLFATGWALSSAIGSAWVIPCTLAHGIVIVHLFAPFHESTHYTAFRTRWLNTAVGWAAGLALMLPPLVFRYDHTAHHKYTQDPALDPQMIAMGERPWGYLYYASAIPYFQGILKGLGRHLLGRLNEFESRNVPQRLRGAVQRQATVFCCIYVAVAVVSVYFESWLVVQLWLIPRIVGEPLMRIIRMSEHVGCARTPSMLENTRTVHTVAPLRLLAWNMAYHTAHHAVPQVPFFRLAALDAVLRDHEVEIRDGYVDVVCTHFRNMNMRERATQG